MTFLELKNQIEELIKQSPYSKEEVLGFLAQEDELRADEILMLGAALEYAQKYQDPHMEHIRQLYEKRLDELERYYSSPTS